MLSLTLESIDPRNATPFQGEHLLGSIGFSGRAAGSVRLRLSLDSAKEVAGRVLGLAPNEVADPDSVNDAVGELLGIMTGNFKSNLCDAGLDSAWNLPKCLPPRNSMLASSRVAALNGWPSAPPRLFSSLTSA